VRAPRSGVIEIIRFPGEPATWEINDENYFVFCSGKENFAFFKNK
jgi:hypothetical protein